MLRFLILIQKKNFLKRVEESGKTLPEKEDALEVVVRIKRLGDSESESLVIYDGTLCTLESLDHLICLHDFAFAHFSKSGDDYTLKLAGLKDTSAS